MNLSIYMNWSWFINNYEELVIKLWKNDFELLKQTNCINTHQDDILIQCNESVDAHADIGGGQASYEF